MPGNMKHARAGKKLFEVDASAAPSFGPSLMHVCEKCYGNLEGDSTLTQPCFSIKLEQLIAVADCSTKCEYKVRGK